MPDGQKNKDEKTSHKLDKKLNLFLSKYFEATHL